MLYPFIQIRTYQDPYSGIIEEDKLILYTE